MATQPQPQPAPGIRRVLEGLRTTGAPVTLEVRGRPVPVRGVIGYVSASWVLLEDAPAVPLRDVRAWRCGGRA